MLVLHVSTLNIVGCCIALCPMYMYHGRIMTHCLFPLGLVYWGRRSPDAQDELGNCEQIHFRIREDQQRNREQLYVVVGYMDACLGLT